KHTTAVGSADLITSPDGPRLENLEIKHNIVLNATDEGIQIRKFNNLLIEHNFVMGAVGEGINLSQNKGGTGHQIIENEVAGNASNWGQIYLYDIDNVEVRGNYLHGAQNLMTIGAPNPPSVYPVTNIQVIGNRFQSTFAPNASRSFAIQINDNGTDNVQILNNEIFQVAGDVAPASYLAAIMVENNPSNITINNNRFNFATATDAKVLSINDAVTNKVDFECNWVGTSVLSEVGNKI